MHNFEIIEELIKSFRSELVSFCKMQKRCVPFENLSVKYLIDVLNEDGRLVFSETRQKILNILEKKDLDFSQEISKMEKKENIYFKLLEKFVNEKK